MRNNKQLWIILLQCLYTLSIFIIDLFIPLGVAAGIPYIAVVLSCLWLRGRFWAIGWALACSSLTLIKLGIATPTEIAAPWVIISNRVLSVAAIITTAIVVRSYKRYIFLSEKEVRKYAEKLEASNKELEHFAYIASHDLQEPLRKIQAFSSRLSIRTDGKLDTDSADYLTRIGNTAARMQGLVNDLLAYSRVGSRELAWEKVGMESVIRDVMHDLELQINETGASVVLEKLPSISCFPLQLQQLFQNLIGNSLKFRREGIPPVIHISSQGFRDGSLFISYRDNGIGISGGSGEKVFNVFYREHGRKYAGSGIGLSICRKIMNRLGGSIRVLPGQGEGTEFELRLPASIIIDAGSQN